MTDAQSLVASGVEGLDEVLGGGFPQGHTCLIHGESGTGKTTLCLQFLMEGARRGERCLYIGTSENERELRVIARSHGWSLDGMDIVHHSLAGSESAQTILHPAEVELPRTVDAMLEAVGSVEPVRLVIDSLAEIRVLARDEFAYRRQLMTLKEALAERACTTLLVEIPTRDRATLNTIVSAVVDLEQVPMGYGPVRRRLSVLKIRGQDFRSGYHDFRIQRGGLEVYPRLIAAASRRHVPLERAGTGLAELDGMLHGGLTRGAAALLLGPSGTGKSLLASRLAVTAAERGERAVLFVFDERLQTVFHRAEQVGLPLESHVEAGLIEIRQIDPAEVTPGEFSRLCAEAAQRQGVRLVVIDSLNGYAYAMPEERALAVHLHELLSCLSQRAVTTVMTMTQHGLLAVSEQPPFDLSYIADTVILLRHFEFAGRVRKALSVYKNRAGPHETAIRELRIEPSGLQIGRPLSEFQGILTGTPTFTGERIDDG